MRGRKLRPDLLWPVGYWGLAKREECSAAKWRRGRPSQARKGHRAWTQRKVGKRASTLREITQKTDLHAFLYLPDKICWIEADPDFVRMG